jgi:periplasmic protein TonB
MPGVTAARLNPPPSTRPPPNRILQLAIGFSLLLHAIILSIHFKLPERIKNSLQSPPLEVTLVNARTIEKPVKPDALAQANLDGGGNTDQKRQLKSPLPRSATDAQRTQLDVAQERVQELEREVQELMAQLKKSKSSTSPKLKPDESQNKQLSEVQERMLELQRLEAQIAKDLEAYQQRPKKKHIGARTAEFRFARYVEDWRLRVEQVGNQNYPQEARDRSVYGNLILTVGIRADGAVESVEIDKSSGKRLLDTAAMRTIKLAAPFAPFPADIRVDTDILYITRTWSFSREDGFETSVKSLPK